jgi:hypothetical protein
VLQACFQRTPINIKLCPARPLRAVLDPNLFSAIELPERFGFPEGAAMAASGQQ